MILRNNSRLGFTLVLAGLVGCGAGTAATPNANSGGANGDDAASGAVATSGEGAAPQVERDRSDEFRAFGEGLVELAKKARGPNDPAVKPETDALLVPNYEQWFEQTFESEVAGPLAREYAELRRKSQYLPIDLKDNLLKGKTEVAVRTCVTPIDMKANGYQNHAMQWMRKPVRLYTLILRQPGEEHGTTFYSFAYVDGAFRMLGPMKAVCKNPPRGDLFADVLCTVPLGEAETLLQGKGMLKEGAVAYLQERGLLRRGNSP